ncbi:MAG: hypothetical protein JJ926_03925 [Roseitalea sp.]|nr:hypothetical protein [Roseitalea sp.]MBO6951005.1 hypothetical protein [Rhizobiaceae bacterium]MBO6591008.1 hypothetical protein [Roseitalea sp.]MBO6599734.1 hypothetical protein [Roseitalea sp.]MBO6611490.1 hypothetical protein [Roseitalea sp.]
MSGPCNVEAMSVDQLLDYWLRAQNDHYRADMADKWEIVQRERANAQERIDACRDELVRRSGGNRPVAAFP